jgi:hypothetical protein
MTRMMRPMTEPTLDLLVQRALLSNDVAYEVLPCDPDMADTAAFCAHYGFAIEQAANTILVASKKVAPPKYAACVVWRWADLHPSALSVEPLTLRCPRDVLEGRCLPRNFSVGIPGLSAVKCRLRS